jgi:transketolase
MLNSDTAGVTGWRELRALIDAAGPDKQVELLHNTAATVRRDDIQMIARAGLGHVGGDLSVTDILVTLYFAVLNVDPADPLMPDRDRFVLSKGHCAGAFYTTLAHAGFFPVAALDTFMAPLSELNGHPNRTKIPGVETNTGPLGHGLPVAVGMAIGAGLAGSTRRVVVVVGDGELQEGSNWEALMTAGHRRLDRLLVIVDRNRLQQGARTEETNGLDPLPQRLTSFGLEVREVDGHDYLGLLAAFGPSTTGRAVAVVANTIKGKGVSFMEDRVEWHHKVPSEEQVQLALAELDG